MIKFNELYRSLICENAGPEGKKIRSEIIKALKKAGIQAKASRSAIPQNLEIGGYKHTKKDLKIVRNILDDMFELESEIPNRKGSYDYYYYKTDDPNIKITLWVIEGTKEPKFSFWITQYDPKPYNLTHFDD